MNAGGDDGDDDDDDDGNGDDDDDNDDDDDDDDDIDASTDLLWCRTKSSSKVAGSFWRLDLMQRTKCGDVRWSDAMRLLMSDVNLTRSVLSVLAALGRGQGL
jgi:hypothetical protein